MKSKIFLLCLSLLSGLSHAKTYYVSPSGSDSAPGSLAQPFKSIQKAADLMQAGDSCLIRSGTYRECVQPPRGGDAGQPITYQAYPGETPVIKGSENISSWVLESGTVWRAEIEDAFFKGYNPYLTNENGPWLNFGDENHLGEVYLDGKPYTERFIKSDLDLVPGTWFTAHAGATTFIWANFGSVSPNAAAVEVNVREGCFIPSVPGLAYISIDGLDLRQGACQWAPPTRPQRGLLNTLGGNHWTIQNCRVSDAKNVGICGASGHRGAGFAQGHHQILANLVERCGQAGIAGERGLNASLIEGNLIQDINYKKAYGGYETGGIKFHNSADLTLKNNIIRRVSKGRGHGMFTGVWVDFANQGCRLTGNVIYDIEDSSMGVCFEMNHGPNLMDNNILIGSPVSNCSENMVFAHNLFVSSGIRGFDCGGESRTSAWYAPHSLSRTGNANIDWTKGDRVFNNIFVASDVEDAHPKDYQADYNVYYQDSLIACAGDAHSAQAQKFKPKFSHTDHEDGVSFSFQADAAPRAVNAPLITKDFIGLVQAVNLSLENPDGSPLSVDEDLSGSKRDPQHPTAGPIEKLISGSNSLRVLAGPGYLKNKIHQPN